MLHLRNSNQDPPVDLYNPEGCDEGDMEIDSLTEEPTDTLLMGDEVISTIPAREIDEFIKSSVDDLVPIPRESQVTSVSIDLEYPLNGDREINFNPCRDIEELEGILANDSVPVPRVFDEPLGNSDLMDKSVEISLLLSDKSSDLRGVRLRRFMLNTATSPATKRERGDAELETFTVLYFCFCCVSEFDVANEGFVVKTSISKTKYG
ncbi:hypothetical protein Tco_0116192 [Tanacetum coccineum]